MSSSIVIFQAILYCTGKNGNIYTWISQLASKIDITDLIEGIITGYV